MIKEKLILGTWPLSGDYGHIPMSEISKVFNYWHNSGFRRYDTSPAYSNGYSEFCLGNFFDGDSSIIFDTKVGYVPFKGVKNFSEHWIETSINESLTRLRATKLGTLYLHNPRIEESEVETLSKFIKSDYIEKTGISLADGFNYPKQLGNFEVVQADFNLLRKNDIFKSNIEKYTKVARSILASGILTEKFGNLRTYENSDHRSFWLKGKKLDSIYQQYSQIKKNFPNESISSLARRYVIFNKNVDNVVVGLKSKKHIDDLLRDIEMGPLKEDQVEKIDEMRSKNFFILKDFIPY